MINLSWPEIDDKIVGMNRYNLCRHMLKSGDILEWSSDNAVGRIIRWFTKRDVNHTGGVIRMTPFEDEPGDRVLTPEAIAGGFELTLLSSSLVGYRGRVYVLPLREDMEHYRKKIVRAQLSLVGRKYDYGGLIANAFGHVSVNARRFFCSEAVAYSLEWAGAIILKRDKKGRKVAPRPGEIARYGATLPRIRIY